MSKDLDGLEDTGLLLHLESLCMPRALLSQQGQEYVGQASDLLHVAGRDVR